MNNSTIHIFFISVVLRELPRTIGLFDPTQIKKYRITTETTERKAPLIIFLFSITPIKSATMIWTLIGMTDAGTETKRSAIAIAKTANTSQTNNRIKTRNIKRARLLIVDEAMSAILLPFSLALVTRAPKS